MTKRSAHAAIAAAVLMVACVRPLVAAPPPDGGTIAIEPTAVEADTSGAAATFLDAASAALAGRGFTILEDRGHAAYVAELRLSRTEVGTGTAKASAGRGAVSPGAYGGVGAVATIPLATGNSALVPLERTELALRIRKRGEDTVIWQGAAMTVRAAGTRRGVDAAVAADLTSAVLRSYPIEQPGVVGVP